MWKPSSRSGRIHYLQYFIELERYRYQAPFDASSMTHFRKRCKHAGLAALQEDLLKRQQEKEKAKQSKKHDNDDEWGRGSFNQGKLIVDATFAPADIAYPADIGLLNGAREESEQLIDKRCAHVPLLQAGWQVSVSRMYARSCEARQQQPPSSA